MHTPAIAVVIPVYNAGRFIDESIDSVRAQKTSQWECMIVDDGSTDETPSRLAAYRDPHIRWIRQDNIGERAARARGVSLTRAPKIVCLDARSSVPRCAGPLREFLGQASSRRCLGVDPPRPFLSTPSQACLRREVVPLAEWLGDLNHSGDWLLLAGAAINHKFAFTWRAPLVKYRVGRSSLMRSIASEYGETIRTGSCLRKAGALQLKEVHS